MIWPRAMLDLLLIITHHDVVSRTSNDLPGAVVSFE